MHSDFIQDLVDEQVRRWEEQKRASKLPFERRSGRLHGPMIAMSREYGALGARVGRMVAKELGFAFYDREIVEGIASAGQVRSVVVESVDEHGRGLIADWVAEFFEGQRMSADAYVRHLSTVLLSIAYHGRAVLVGRGACFLLDPSLTLRVRAHAPLEIRIQRVAESHNLSLDKARETVAEFDKARGDFIRKHFGREPGDCHGYDLMLDTGTIPLEACARIVSLAFRARFDRRVASRPAGTDGRVDPPR